MSMEELRKKISKLENNDLKDIIIALFEQIEQLSDDIMRLYEE